MITLHVACRYDLYWRRCNWTELNWPIGSRSHFFEAFVVGFAASDSDSDFEACTTPTPWICFSFALGSPGPSSWDWERKHLELGKWRLKTTKVGVLECIRSGEFKTWEFGIFPRERECRVLSIFAWRSESQWVSSRKGWGFAGWGRKTRGSRGCGFSFLFLNFSLASSFYQYFCIYLILLSFCLFSYGWHHICRLNRGPNNVSQNKMPCRLRCRNTNASRTPPPLEPTAAVFLPLLPTSTGHYCLLALVRSLGSNITAPTGPDIKM